MPTTAELAPPCSLPHSAQMPAETEANRLASEERSLLCLLHDLHNAPTLGLGQRTSLHNANAVAYATLVLLVMAMELLVDGHHLSILGVVLAIGDLHGKLFLIKFFFIFFPF